MFASSLVIADVTGDGHLDIVIGRLVGEGSVQVTRNNSQGRFEEFDDLSVSGIVGPLLGEDLDGDGDVDVVACHGGLSDAGVLNECSVLLNTGTGEFAPAVRYLVGEQPLDAELGDFDGDGDLDLVVIASFENRVVLLANNGDGSFADRREIAAFERVDGMGGPQSLAAADFDGDADVDLVVLNRFMPNVITLANSGDAVFATQQTVPLPGFESFHITVADLDRDGRPDVLVSGDLARIIHEGQPRARRTSRV